MIENLKTNTGNYTTYSQANIPNAVVYPDSIGHYYSASDVLNNVCPTGWHIPTVNEWQDLHYEIYGTSMNPNGFTNNAAGYDNNNYPLLWNTHEGNGTNQSFFNLFTTGRYLSNNGDLDQDYYAAHFYTTSSCGSNLYIINILNQNYNYKHFLMFLDQKNQATHQSK